MSGNDRNQNNVPYRYHPGNGKKPDDNNDNDNDDSEKSGGDKEYWGRMTSQARNKNNHNKNHNPNFIISAAAIPHLAGLAFKTLAGITLALYILNQKHLLPRPLSAVVSKTLFWPTMPITASKRIGKWVTRIDDTVVIGGAPFGFLGFPERLYNKYGVRGVINLCEEYKGPLKKYGELGMEQLYLPTTDHFEPDLEALVSAVLFIKRHQAHGNSVYVHCRAGHGRSAAAVFAWLLYKDPIVDTKDLNVQFCKLRNVRTTLWKQPNLQTFHNHLKTKGTIILNIEKENEKDNENNKDNNNKLITSIMKESKIINDVSSSSSLSSSSSSSSLPSLSSSSSLSLDSEEDL